MDKCFHDKCENKVTHFIVHKYLGEEMFSISWACLYHYCLHYGFDAKDEHKRMKQNNIQKRYIKYEVV